VSQLLARLKRDLDLSADPMERAELSAQIAGNLARLGRFDDARKVVGAVREQFGQGQSGRVTVWLMLAEGLIHHFESLSPAALDRVRGAQALGSAMGYSTIVALASAWKAHIEFERSDFESMVSSIDLALKNVGADEHDAQTRLAIVLSNAFMIAGDRNQAQLWFKHGHQHAVMNGDQASIDALVYNRAAFLLARLRTLSCKASIPKEELVSVRMEIASAKNLQNLIRLAALGGHVHLLDARLQLLESKFESAISALQVVRGTAPFAPHNFDQKFIELEVCYCQLMLGQNDAALMHIPSMSDDEFDGLDIDERVVAAWMLWKMATTDARAGAVDYLWSHFVALWSKYEAMCDSLASRLLPFHFAPSSSY
jgi:ATP/maltotriose-dependent transcriptional regulator MalT